MRQARKLQENARYHVIARANRKEMLLDSACNKDLFLEIVAKARLSSTGLVDQYSDGQEDRTDSN